MTMLTYGQNTQRIGRFKGKVLKHAVPREVLAKTGKQESLPANNGDTYIARRWLPYNAAATDANTINRYFPAGAGDRGNSMVSNHIIQEGVTPAPDTLYPQDVQVVVQQYGCLYGYTDKVALLYEDDIPEQMAIQAGERVALVNEMIVYGAVRAGTNQYFGGTGTTRATVNGTISLNMLRRIARNLQANHAMPVNKVLAASGNYATQAVEEGYLVYCHTDLEPNIRDLPGFVPAVQYASGKPLPNEIGKVERFRFITSPDLPALLDAGATVAASPGLQSQSGTNIDVYQFIVAAEDAWSQISVRGKNAMKVADIPVDATSNSDPFGQRGYAGVMWWKAVLVENNGWFAVGNVGISNLPN